MDINFYYVKKDYIDFLKKQEIDNRSFTCVPNTIYSSREKFLFGAVFEMNGINYFVPVSSKTKGRDNDILISSPKKSEKIESLRFQYMIPVPNKCIVLLRINDIPKEGQRQRIRNELKFCRKNIHKIKLQAQKTYNAITASKNDKLKRNSCDFKLLENAYIIYCHDNALDLSEEMQKKYYEITNKFKL